MAEDALSSMKPAALPIDCRAERGPFDLIGDVHGCFAELMDLLSALGYTRHGLDLRGPAGRRLVFVGDLVDRGPDSPGVLRLVAHLVATRQAFCVPGNHDVRLMHVLQGRETQLNFGLAETLDQLAPETDARKEAIADFIESLPSHLILDEGRLIVAHAGLKEGLHGSGTTETRSIAIHGEKTGKRDQFGDIRYAWAADYRGTALVVFGHTPVPAPVWLNNTVNIDTGAVFGGRLTALRYPERELVSVPMRCMYYRPTRPFLPNDKRLARR